MDRQQISALFWESPIDSFEDGFLQLQHSYRLKPVEIMIGGTQINLIKVSNIDDLLERANDPDEIPFWAELWPSSIGLAQHISENRTRFGGKSILELGSGVGLSGISAKLAGGEVIQSDFSSEALRFTQVNCIRNHVPADRLLLADWRNFPAAIGNFEWIIGADILYEKNLHNDLLKIFSQSLKAGGSILLADPGRNYAKDFIGRSILSGWQVKESQYPVTYEGRTYQIDIYRLQSAGTS
jgi:Predicted methyltransferase